MPCRRPGRPPRRRPSPGTDAAQRDLVDERFTSGLRERRGHLGLDVTGSDGVHPHVAGRHLTGQRLGEADDPGLGRRVVGLPRIAAPPDHARDAHDGAPAPFDHAAQHRLGDEEGALEVHRHDRVPLVLVHEQQDVVAGDAGVVDEDVHRAESLLHGRGRFLGFSFLGDVGLVEAGGQAGGLFDLLGRLRAVVGHVHDADLGPLRRQLQRDGLADPPGAAGDEGHLAFERPRGGRDDSLVRIGHHAPPLAP